MNHHRTMFIATAMSFLSVGAIALPAAAEQWYFWVKNDSTANIKKLLVSENGKEWGYFNIGSGIAPGKTAKLIWSESTNSESCTQWIKAEFSTGDQSEPAKFDFCKDLEEPIIFE